MNQRTRSRLDDSVPGLHILPLLSFQGNLGWRGGPGSGVQVLHGSVVA